jgi:hypothetical protein
MSTSHTENTVNDYSEMEKGYNASAAFYLFAAAAAGVAYVASRPRVQRAWRELMTPEPKPQNATVNVTAE